MFLHGKDMISTIVLSTQSPRMIEAVCIIVGLLLMVNQITFVVGLLLITVNLEYLSSSVNGSMEIPGCVETK